MVKLSETVDIYAINFNSIQTINSLSWKFSFDSQTMANVIKYKALAKLLDENR